jgi:hypothetical protein
MGQDAHLLVIDRPVGTKSGAEENFFSAIVTNANKIRGKRAQL